MGHVLIKSQFRKLKKQLYHNVNHTQIREQQKETFFFFGRLMECFHFRDQHDSMLVSPHGHEKETERNRCIRELYGRQTTLCSSNWTPVGLSCGTCVNSIMTPVTSFFLLESVCVSLC